MKIYKTIKKIASNTPKIAAIGFIAAMPYICESCGYSGKKVSASEIIPVTSQIQAENLETVLEK